MNIQETLQSIGMSNAETKVYLTILQEGRCRAGVIIKTTGLQSSVVHNSLNTLLEKGFINYVLVGNIKEYGALDPSVISEYIDAKKTAFNHIVPQLKKMRTKQTLATAEVYEGYQGILNAMLTVASEAKKGETYKYFAAGTQVLSPEALAFFEKADLVRKAKGVIVKGIAHQGDKKVLQAYTMSQLKYTDQHIPPAMNIYQDKVLLINLQHKPTAVLIHSKEIALQYHRLWGSIWKTSKK